ncbi:MAG: peptide MFS transporter [Acidobacteria bacterium]|nr:peptide MFS transporter [Acidobacteriota bacterium]MCW5948271.1 peptide MFS transporter [Pyrinomonadaceae bacterium]
MSANAQTINAGAVEKHPKGLAVLFATEMWERFSFYSMLALFTLYLRDPKEGFGWTAADATWLYSTYLMFVYLSPLVGGFIADRFTGYRKAVMIGGFFFMAGHATLSIPAIWAVYLALTFLVIGNGFFKPNVSTMVGNLYPEGSHLKDRAYNIFYMGINVGAALAPIVMEIVKHYFGFHAAFAVAAFGMVISVFVLWKWKNLVMSADRKAGASVIDEHVIEAVEFTDDQPADAAAVAVDAPPHEVSQQDTRSASQKASDLMNTVSEGKRIMALIVVFLIVIVFWMVFHQNGSTLTYWADDNTAWNVTGTISNSINAIWILILTFPLVAFWGFLDRRGKEPSTPTKMAFGMTLTGLSFLVLWYAAILGEGMVKTPEMLSSGEFRVNERVLANLGKSGVPAEVLEKIQNAKADDGKNLIFGVKYSKKTDEVTKTEVAASQQLVADINKVAPGEGDKHKDAILQNSYLFRVSPFWLIFAYMIVTLGELMLSPMGLSLVSKVAPISKRGLLMGGWFVATAIGNKLTQIGVFWDIWLQSTFFLVLAAAALIMAVVLFLILKPLKRAMPGV